jgi:hypothetical protein
VRSVSIRATSVAHGAASFDALASSVRAAKAGDPLAPVTVIVPTNTAGVMARRALGRRGGAAAVDVLTLYRVAELLGAPPLVAAGRQPVSTPIVDLAIKEVLAARPGRYRDVADHPSTIVALRNVAREVRLAGPGATQALTGTGRGREPARVVTEMAQLLAAQWYDEADLLEQATAELRRAAPHRFRRVIVHGPERWRPLELELVRALGEVGDVDLVVALTADADADASVVELVRDLTGTEPSPAGGPIAPAGHLRVVSTTDADDEVRLAVRAILDGARAGTAFDRMALLWPAERPYARLVEHHLAAAGLPWNGRPGTTVIERTVPRVLAELLELDRRGLRRADLMTLLGDVPARGEDGRPVPTARWERIGRAAGIVREADWERQLPRWIAETRRRATELGRPSMLTHVEHAEALGRFVAGLRAALGDPAATRTWAGWVRWCYERLEGWFGGRLERLDDVERLAWLQTEQVLDRLHHLDTIGRPVTRAEFRATFVAELDLVPARRGTIGDGVHVGSLAGARGLDLDLVVLVGAADGLMPPPPAIDPLLGDDDRRRAGLVTSDERARNAHRQFLAVTHTTPQVTIVVPRGDLRATTVHHRSRWATPLLAHAAGGEELVDSHAHGLASAEFPLSDGEHRLRELWVHARSGADVRRHPRVAGDLVLTRALQLRDARASAALTIFDGDLTSRSIPTFDRPIAPTRIEAWAKCPHAYFVRYVLGVEPVDEPSDIVDISALDRGSAIHDAVDRLHRLVLDGHLPAPDATGWSDEHAIALLRIAEDIADDLELAGRTGRAAYWAGSRADLLAELGEWIDAERERWAGRRLLASEHAFGEDRSVTLALPDGRSIAFRGSIDRVDELPDGTLIVTDHKTGSVRDYQGLELDPTNDGRHFQLPVYAAAARVLTGRPEAVVRAEYAFFRKGKFARFGARFDEPSWKLALTRLGDVVDGIESGLFPATPEPPGWRLFVPCRYCEPDELGTMERYPEWERKRHDPRLARWYGDEAEGTIDG